jgi:hypothetical protein
MKQLLGYVLSLIMSASALGAQAQHSLAGTAWQGTALVPERTAVVFQFKRDTVYMYEQASRAVLETMVYSTNAQQLTWRKVSGGSPCDPKVSGTYAYRIDKDRIFLTLVSDACDARRVLNGESFKKVIWPTP